VTTAVLSLRAEAALSGSKAYGQVVPVTGTYGMQMLLRGVTNTLSERVMPPWAK